MHYHSVESCYTLLLAEGHIENGNFLWAAAKAAAASRSRGCGRGCGRGGSRSLRPRRAPLSKFPPRGLYLQTNRGFTRFCIFGTFYVYFRILGTFYVYFELSMYILVLLKI